MLCKIEIKIIIGEITMELVAGIAGVLLGVFSNEYIRRINRVENFNSQIFDRRLQDYIGLLDLITGYYTTAITLMKNEMKLNNEDIFDEVSGIIFDITTYLDSNSMFISDELAVQCSTLYMGIEDVDKKQLEIYEDELTRKYKNTIVMIKSESGVDKINKKMKKILRYKHSSEIINYYKKLKKEYKKNKI